MEKIRGLQNLAYQLGLDEGIYIIFHKMGVSHIILKVDQPKIISAQAYEQKILM
jgi:hypothetical protein